MVSGSAITRDFGFGGGDRRGTRLIGADSFPRISNPLFPSASRAFDVALPDRRASFSSFVFSMPYLISELDRGWYPIQSDEQLSRLQRRQHVGRVKLRAVAIVTWRVGHGMISLPWHLYPARSSRICVGTENPGSSGEHCGTRGPGSRALGDRRNTITSAATERGTTADQPFVQGSAASQRITAGLLWSLSRSLLK